MNPEESPPYEDRELRGNPYHCPKFWPNVGKILAWGFIVTTLPAIVYDSAYPTVRQSGCRWIRYCPNNLKMIGLDIEMYSSETYYGKMPPGNNSQDIINALYIDGGGIESDWSVFQCPSRKKRVPAKGQSDYLFFPNLSLAKAPNFIVAADKPGNHADGGYLLYMDTHAKYVKASPEKYAAWAQAFAAGDIKAATLGPGRWSATGSKETPEDGEK